MKAFSAATLLCFLCYFSLFTAAQSLPVGPTVSEQIRESQNWWSLYVQYESLRTLGKIQKENLFLDEYVSSHPSERNKDYKKQVKKLAKQAAHLCKLNHCEESRGDSSQVAKNIANTDAGDLFNIYIQSGLAVHAETTARTLDRKYPLYLLSIKDATRHLKERFSK